MFSGGPYGSTIAELSTAIEKSPKVCGAAAFYKASEEAADAAPFIKIADDNAAIGAINALNNLKDVPIFIQTGRWDETVPSFLQYT